MIAVRFLHFLVDIKMIDECQSFYSLLNYKSTAYFRVTILVDFLSTPKFLLYHLIDWMMTNSQDDGELFYYFANTYN